MIYKFDHITLVASRNRREEVLFQGINSKFKELNLPNANNKAKLMQDKQLSHDLYFYEDEKLYWTTEIILYDRVGKNTGIKIENNCVWGSYSDLHSAYDFLAIIFGKAKVTIDKDIITCNLKGVLDRKDYILKLLPNDDCDVYLDSAGYGVITLFTNTIKIKSRSDILLTEYESVGVNGKLLQICFAKSKYVNIIFEFIKMEAQI